MLLQQYPVPIICKNFLPLALLNYKLCKNKMGQEIAFSAKSMLHVITRSDLRVFLYSKGSHYYFTGSQLLLLFAINRVHLKRGEDKNCVLHWTGYKQMSVRGDKKYT